MSLPLADFPGEKTVEQGIMTPEIGSQHRKLDAVATLAAGIAHQFNNALHGLTGNLELLQMDLSSNERIDRYIDPMMASIQRMSLLTNQLLAYAQGGKYQPRIMSLRSFLTETIPLLNHHIEGHIRITTEFHADSCRIEADSTQMWMVLSNIVNNAAEAMGGKGYIRITLREEAMEAHPYPNGLGRYVCLSVEDNGKGMDAETKNRIFDPFFTTKGPGRGLGMAAVWGIVKNHKGWITVESESGRGTDIRVYLPAVPTPAAEVRFLKKETGNGSRTVLVIEDEEIVMNVIRALLERLGYCVLEAKTGTEALNLSRAFHGLIDLALLDIGLPDMGGNEVLPLLKKMRPDLKVVIASGYAVDGPAREMLNSGAQGFLQKPFSLSTLSAEIDRVLA